MLRTLPPALAVCLSVLCACGPTTTQEPPPAPRTEVITPGSGDPNALPLWPLTPGTTYRMKRPTSPIFVSDPVEVNGVTVLRLASDERYSGYARPSPNEPAFLKYLSVSPDGILFHGTLRAGFFSSPVLLVPREVRLGMKWVARTDGNEPRFVFEVVAKKHELTRYGEGTTWTIAVDDRSLLDFVGAAKEGADFQVTFFEGAGPVDRLPFIDTGYVFETVVRPLDEAPRPATTYPAVTLRRMLDGKPVFDQQLIYRTSFIEDPAQHGDGFLMTGYGVSPSLNPTDPNGGTGFGSDFSGACTIVRSTGLAAPTDCAEASGVLIRTDGTHAQVPANIDGTVLPHATSCSPGDDCPQLEMLGLYADGAETKVFARGATILDEYVFGPIDPAKTFDNVDGPRAERMKNLFRNADLALPAPLWMAEKVGDEVRFGIPVRGGRVFGAMGPDGVTRGGQQVLLLDGPVSVTARPGEALWLAVSPDGFIDRVRLGDGGFTVEPLARVTVPAGAWVVGATLHAGKLIAAVQEHYQGFDTQYDLATGERDMGIQPEFGGLYLWEGDLPAPAAAAPPRPIVTATPLQRDVRVCWPPGSGAPDLDRTHWTLGTATLPDVVVPAGTDGACVLLVRNPSQVSDLGGVWTVEGPVPGVGRVSISMAPLVQFDRGADAAEEWPEDLRLANTRVSPLAGGGLVTEFYVYGPGATLGRGYGNAVANYVTVPDLAGAGLWYPLVTSGPSEVMLSTASGRKRFTVPGMGDAHLEPVMGSGVVVSHGGVVDGLLHPDGTLTPVADATGLGPLWTEPDGTVCGVLTTNPTALRCRDVAGTDTRTGSWDCTRALGFGKNGRIYAMDDVGGRLCVLTRQASTVSTQTVTLSQYGLTAAAQYLQAPDGKAYLFQEFSTASGFRHVLIDLDKALTSTANVMAYLDQPFLLGQARVKVVAEEGLLTFFPTGYTETLPKVIRAPRP
jgi:hypothetical protein